MLFHKFYNVYSILITLVLARDINSNEMGSREIKPQGRLYSLSTCAYRTEPGYTCLSCSRALRCYPTNIAILVDCYGLFQYCLDGHCSMFKGSKCFTDIKVTTELPNAVAANEVTSHDSLVPVTLLENSPDNLSQEIVALVEKNLDTASEGTFNFTETHDGTELTSQESITKNNQAPIEKNLDPTVLNKSVTLIETHPDMSSQESDTVETPIMPLENVTITEKYIGT